MLSIDPLSLDSDMLDEAKAYLRLENEEEDAPFGAILLAALAQAERYLGQILIRRNMREILPTSTAWQRLHGSPFVAANGATGLPAEGASFAFAGDAYAVDVDARGDAWIRVKTPGAAGRVELAYQAGLAGSWATLPEAMRLGVLRLVAHSHAHRDDPNDGGMPDAVTALLRPWRRVRLA
jgi:uncharacterized phiE125 gp8 family phage protein